MSEDASARLSGPSAALSEADYARMHDTLTETVRGRGFLEEFARRNRTADTRMVLDAVARIGNVVAAQQAIPSAPVPDPAKAIRRLIQNARASLPSASRSDSNEVLTQARRATRIIREIAWQMRGSGNDPRICNILDTQLEAIDAQVYAPATDPDAGLRAQVETLLTQIEAAIGDSADDASDRPHDLLAEDDAVLTRIAAEMARDDDPEVDAFEDPRVRPDPHPARREQSGDSLGEMLIARGIVRPTADRDTPPDHRIN